MTTNSGAVPEKKAYTVERPRFPLVLKLFGLTALLILIVVAVAIGLTIQRANAIADDTVKTSIASAARLFRDFETQRLLALASATQLLGSDVSFSAYIQSSLHPEGALAAPDPNAPPVDPSVPPATPVIDINSINDQLLQNRDRLGVDIMMLLDDQGVLVARTDEVNVAGGTKEDFYEKTPLVKTIVDDQSIKQTSGVLSLGDKLYHAAVAPVLTDRVVRGYLINAYAIDEKFANSIAQSANAGVIFAPKGSNTPVRSSNAPSAMADPGAKTGETTVDQSRYIFTTEALRSGRETVGNAIFLRSLDRELAPFREIEQAMLVGGGIALLLAFLSSWLIAK
ncbi:MAG TPA: CHASE4 domain-containing protein, partial [Thermoanaerobaculia bacterium]